MSNFAIKRKLLMMTDILDFGPVEDLSKDMTKPKHGTTMLRLLF
jgi:cell division protein FtsZ